VGDKAKRELEIGLDGGRPRIAKLDAIGESSVGNSIVAPPALDYPYRVFTDRMNEGTATLTVDGTVLFCNRKLAEMTGMSPEKLLGSPLSSILRQDQENSLQELLRLSFSNPIRTEGKLARKDGTVLPVRFSLSLVSLNKLDRVICVVISDLSEFNQAKQGLKEHAELFDQAHDAILIRGLDGRIRSWNPGAAELYGWSAEEALGKISFELLHTAFPEPMESIAASLQESKEWQGEITHIHRDGKAIVVASRWSLLRDDEGNPSAILEINRDITLRNESDARLRRLNQDLEYRVTAGTLELRESEELVRRKLQSMLMPEGDLQRIELADILDVPAVLELAEQACALTSLPLGILDLEGNILVGAGWQRVCKDFHRAHPEACQNCKESDRTLSTGVAAGEFKYYKCKNRMWDVVTPIILGDRHVGNLFSGQFFFEDEITDFEEFAEQARSFGFDEDEYLAALRCVPRLSRERVRTVMEFYGKLTDLLTRLGHSGIKVGRAMTETNRVNAQLANSVKELESFSYSVSHDLRAPLRHMDGFLTLLSKRSYSQFDDLSKHYFDRTLDASRRMGRLIDDLLHFFRIARTEMDNNPVDLNAVVKEVRNELEFEVRDRAVVWHLESLPTVNADRSMLRQIFQNLLGNALKFTRDRTPAEIAVGSQSGPDGEVVVFVRDNGAGFDMQYSAKLFQVFQRLHSEKEFEGTGIGLANVRRFVERHGGRVWAEGSVGAGAAFFFALPADRTERRVGS
jgi:PAS domain S-box-containing protein